MKDYEGFLCYYKGIWCFLFFKEKYCFSETPNIEQSDRIRH